MAPLFCCSLQMCLKQTLSDSQQNYQSVVQLSPQALEDLQWWELHLEWEKPDYPNTINDNNVRCLPNRLGCNLQPEVHVSQPNSLFTLIAWLPHLQSRYMQRRSQGFQSFCAWTIPHLLPTSTERMGGGTVSPMLLQQTKDLCLWCMKRNILLQAKYLPGVLNTIANEESRT